MRSLIMKQAERFLRERKNGKRWLTVFTCLAAMVALGTVMALRYTGTAMTGDPQCGAEEHSHAEACYQENLICGQEGEEGHEHTAECYEKQLICSMEEHSHMDTCYKQEEETTAQETEEAQAAADSGEGPGAAPEIQEQAKMPEQVEVPEIQEQVEAPEADAGRHTLTIQGEDYAVTASYGEEAGLPENAELSVEEILEGSAEYEAYYQKMLAAVAGEPHARFFDITFMADGVEVEPAAPVDIRISYLNAAGIGEDGAASVLRFTEDGTERLDAEVIENEEGRGLAFTREK